MVFVPLTTAETDADSPLDTTLFTKIKDNFDAHDAALSTAFNLYADGSSGPFSSSASVSIGSQIYRHTTFVINAAHVMNVSAGSSIIIIATTSITINGSLVANGVNLVGGAPVSSSVGNPGGGGQAGSGGGGGYGGAVGGAGGDSSYLDVINSGGSGGSGAAGGVGVVSAVTRTAFGLMGDFRRGAGGGSGGSNSGASGAGGKGGGCIILIAPTVTIGASGFVRANGEAGGPGALSTGGGGGGGGGSIIVLSGTYTNNGTVEALGGAGGAGGTNGYAGGAGGAGLVDIVQY